MKRIKELTKKAEDLRKKVSQNCADYDYENPVYGSPEQQLKEVNGWIQAHHDILMEILKLRIAIQITNINTSLEIAIGDKVVKKTVAEWVHRRRDLANLELMMWRGIHDGGRKDGYLPKSNPTAPDKEAKVRRYYDPRQRDERVNLYTAEPLIIDAALEVCNATTDVVGIQ